MPSYRGAAPIQWAVINGDKVSGVTTMQMNEGLDTGDMIMKTEVPLAEDETGGSLHDKLAKAGAKLCVETLKALEDKTATWETQGESPTAYAKMLDKKLGDIDWSKSAKAIECLIRGLNPWPSAYTDWNGKVMKIWEAKVLDENTDATPGTIVKSGKRRIFCTDRRRTFESTGTSDPWKEENGSGRFLTRLSDRNRNVNFLHK